MDHRPSRPSADLARPYGTATHGPPQPSADGPDDLIAKSTAVLAQHGRSFSLASVFLPEDRRGQAAVLYAFCRLADDVVDEASDPDEARAGVADLRSELEGHAPARPVVAATREILAPVGLQPALDLLHGVESDLDFEIPADDAALDRYCYEVAGTVGLMMCAALGVRETWAFDPAVKLGMGMQLTNICRDVLEDAERGRVYLPADRLAAAGVSAESLLEGTADAGRISGIVRDLLDRADDHYTVGRTGFPALPFRSRVAIAVAARLYQGIGHRLRRHGADPLAGRTVVPAWEKGVLVVRAGADLLGAGLR
ncbi:MAG: phytoene/squalene synthase family protein [Myxococcota bacterium]